MSMAFWEAQRQARKRTVIIFIVFIAMTVAAAALIEWLIHIYSVDTGQRTTPFIGLLFLGITLLVAGWNFLIYRSHGGAAVAESVGGIEVGPEHPEPRVQQFYNVVSEIAIASRLPIPKVYVLDVGQINAFAAGMKTDNAAIAVTRGALEQLSRDELQGVIAHEFGHVRNGDMRLNMCLSAMVMGFFIISYIGIRMLEMSALSGRRNASGLIGLAFVVAGLFSWFFGAILRSMTSRQRELLADASAVEFTRNPEGLIGALQKIDAQETRDMPKRGMAISHMYFDHQSLMGRLFATHPPIEKRIAALRGTS
jgi:heat shock protein HtpX